MDERVATHSLRKSFAKAVYEGAGHDLILTQRALGHGAITTTSGPGADRRGGGGGGVGDCGTAGAA